MAGFKLCALAAFVTGVSATAAMAATQVNIADPANVNRKAHVEIGGRLAVQEVEPTSYFHSAHLGIYGCTAVAVPLPGKALIVRQVRVHSITGGYITLHANADCSYGGIVGEVNLPISGGYTESFDPGITIPAGGTLSAEPSDNNNVSGDIYVDGYTVASSVAPTVGQTIQVRGRLQQR